MKKLCLIKIGGSVMSDKATPLSYRQKTVERLVKEFSELRDDHPDTAFIIGNGAGSFGHYTVHKVNYLQEPSDKTKIDAVRRSVAALNTRLVAALNAAGVPTISFPPSQYMRQHGPARLKLATEKLIASIESGEVPVAYGDVIDTADSTRIASTEEVLEVIAQHLSGVKGFTLEACFYMTSTDGVLDANGNTVPVVRADTLLHHITNDDFDVTGGMQQKVTAGIQMLRYAKQVAIVGSEPGSLANLLSGPVRGTRLES